MIEPIVLTEFGETLIFVSPSESKDYDDKRRLPSSNGLSYAGLHKADNGFIYPRLVSETHYVIHCAVCGRITTPIPKEVDTYGKLREWCRSKILRQREERLERAEDIIAGSR